MFLLLVAISLFILLIVNSLARPKREADAAATFKEFVDLTASRTSQESKLLNQIHDELRYGKSETEIYASLQNQGYNIGAIADAMRVYKTFINSHKKSK